MEWLDKLGDCVLSGLTTSLGGMLPEHWRRDAYERLKDFNPFDVMAGNHDLLRAARLAWIRAALDVLETARKSAKSFSPAASSEFNQLAIFVFEEKARDCLVKIRSAALDRCTDPGSNPIDRHLQLIMQGTSEFVAPGEQGALDQSITDEFITTLAKLTGWGACDIPSIFWQIARDGLPIKGGGAKRSFGKLVFADFAELLKSPKRYPELKVAFHIAIQDAARKQSEAILECVEGIDDKVDKLIARADALQIFLTGAEAYLQTLPKFLEGKEQIEAIVLSLTSDIRSIKNDTSEIKQLLQKFEGIAESNTPASEEEMIALYQTLVAHLKRGKFEQLLTYKPTSLEIYRAQCIARWVRSDYAIDKRFTPLTLLIDQGEDAQGERYQQDNREFNDLREMLSAADLAKEPVLVVTGAPGSGKSTLLRRLERDLANEALRTNDPQMPLTLFLPLNAFGLRSSTPPDPADWSAKQGIKKTNGLPDFDTILRNSPFILLLDGLNEMPHSGDYDARLAAWKGLLDEWVRDYPKLRIVFSCRTLDYGSKLTTKELPHIPQVKVNQLNDEQVASFLSLYSPKHGTALWGKLRNSPQIDLYRSPFYLRLLIEQASDGHIPEGRASLFTGYVRAMLKREFDGDNPRLKVHTLLHPRDRQRFGQWETSYELPKRGQLFKALAAFAFGMQARRAPGDKSQVRLRYDDGLDLLTGVPDDEKLKDSLLMAAVDMQILDLSRADVLFVHQLLQEYFAARHLAECIDAANTADELTALCRLTDVKWLEADISPSVREELESLSKSGTLPDLPTTGWEETFPFLLAIEMVANPGVFLRMLAEYNLPLAGRCAAQPEVTLSDDLRAHLQRALVSGSRDPATDLRARIQAVLALGYLGDPRFERRQGPFGPFLFPPMVAIDGGTYPIGSDEGLEENEAPQHEFSLAPCSLGQFPVTNAEYRCFIEAGGYQDDRWWKTPVAQSCRKGEKTGDA